MPTRRAGVALAGYLAHLVLGAEGLTWRIFSTTVDCVATHVPAVQWSSVGPSSLDLQTELTVNLAFLASDVKRTNKSPALVDTWLLNAHDAVVFERSAVSELDSTFTVRGDQGPWRLCFQQRADHGRWRPSAEIQLDAFDIHIADFWGSKRATSLSNSGNHTTSWRYMLDQVDDLPTSVHVSELHRSLQHLDEQLQHMGKEQKHMQHRAEGHLSVVQGTQQAVAFWTCLQVLGFMASAGLQVAFVRLLFSPKHTLPLYSI